MTTIHVLTRKDAKAALRREERGYQFPLPWTAGVYSLEDAPLNDRGQPDRTMIGVAKAVARVRRIPLADLANVVGLTSDMQATILDVFRILREGKGLDLETWDEVSKSQAKNRDLANGLVMLGFLEPRVVATAEEADALGEGAIPVEEIDVRDRLRYLNHIVQPEGEAARSMRPFPEPGLASSQPAQSGEAEPPAIRPVADAEVGPRPVELSVV